MTYNAMRKKLNSLSTYEILEDGSFAEGVNYNASYSFNGSREAFIRSSTKLGLLLILFVISVNFFWSELLGFTAENRIKFMLLLIFSFLMVLVILYSFYSSIKSLPKLSFNYIKGTVKYNDGIQAHEFKVKSITSIVLVYPYYKSSRWQLRINIWGLQQPVMIDVLKFEEPETIYRLLTNFNDKVKIY